MRVRRFLFLPMVLVVGIATAVTGAVTSAGVASASTIDTAQNPAVSTWGTDRLDVFARATDGTLQHKVFDGRWSAWENLGGNITSGPAAVAWASGRIDVFARGSSGTLMHRWFTGLTWSVWEDLGGGLVGSPTVSSWGTGRLDVFVRGTDNAVHHKAFSSGSGWSGWQNLGGTVNSAPAAASWDKNRIDVVVRGGGNALYHKWWNGSAWAQSWENLGGSLASSPAMISGSSGYLSIFARNSSNVVTTKAFGPTGWTGWSNMDGTIVNAPAAAAWSASRIDLFAFNSSGALQQRIWIGFVGWGPWQPVPESGPAMAPAPYSPSIGLQVAPASGATVGGLVYAYVDNIGRVVYGTQSSPDIFSDLQWTVISGNNAHTGPPGIAQQANGQVQVSAENANGDLWANLQSATSANATAAWLSRGGQFGASAVRVTRQTDGTIIVLALDPAGGLWSLPQPAVGSDFRTWAYLGISGLKGVPAAVAGQDGLELFGVDSSGAVQTATLAPSGTMTAWTSLGGSGFTDTPAAVIVPGYRVRLFARAADGTLVTKMQDSALAWPAAWTSVGSQVGIGSPAAVLSPLSGKIEVVMRGPASAGNDSPMFSTGEVSQGSGTWRAWQSVLIGETTATDPTILSFSNSSGPQWAFMFRTADQQSRIYLASSTSGSVSASGLTDSTDTGAAAADAPTFTRNSLPAPPQ